MAKLLLSAFYKFNQFSRPPSASILSNAYNPKGGSSDYLQQKPPSIDSNTCKFAE